MVVLATPSRYVLLMVTVCGVSILLYSVIIIFCVPTKFYCIPIRPVC